MRPALPIALGLALAASAVHAQQSGSSDEPPRVQDSLEAPGGTVVRPPPALPPGALLERDPRVGRSRELLDRLELHDDFVARFARQSQRLLAVSSPDCEALATLGRAMSLSRSESTVSRRTVASELVLLPDAELVQPLRDRLAVAEQRALDSAEAWAALQDEVGARCPGLGSEAPTVWLPENERGAVDDRVVAFVRAERSGQVVWVSDVPAGQAAEDGWAVVVAPVGEAVVCSAAPESEACSPGVSVTMTAAAAYDLR